MESVGRERIAAHEAMLRDYATERSAAINSLTIFGTAPDKGAILAFNIDGAHPHDIATIIDRAGVAVRAGTHCAQPLLARYGTTATCRASFGLYNTREEVDRLAEALQKAHDFFACEPWTDTNIARPSPRQTLRNAARGASVAPHATGSAIPPEELERLTATSSAR